MNMRDIYNRKRWIPKLPIISRAFTCITFIRPWFHYAYAGRLDRIKGHLYFVIYTHGSRTLPTSATKLWEYFIFPVKLQYP